MGSNFGNTDPKIISLADELAKLLEKYPSGLTWQEIEELRPDVRHSHFLSAIGYMTNTYLIWESDKQPKRYGVIHSRKIER